MIELRFYDKLEDYMKERDCLPMKALCYVKEGRRMFYQSAYDGG